MSFLNSVTWFDIKGLHCFCNTHTAMLFATLLLSFFWFVDSIVCRAHSCWIHFSSLTPGLNSSPNVLPQLVPVQDQNKCREYAHECWPKLVNAAVSKHSVVEFELVIPDFFWLLSLRQLYWSVFPKKAKSSKRASYQKDQVSFQVCIKLNWPFAIYNVWTYFHSKMFWLQGDAPSSPHCKIFDHGNFNSVAQAQIFT